MVGWLRSSSLICWAILSTGFSDVIGSWKTIDSSDPHRERRALALAPTSSLPRYRADPATSTLFEGSSPMIVRDSTDLPDPDSPTMPSVRPCCRVNVTPFTAFTRPDGVRNVVQIGRAHV